MVSFIPESPQERQGRENKNRIRDAMKAGTTSISDLIRVTGLGVSTVRKYRREVLEEERIRSEVQQG